jgi:hypothetical protein
MIGRTADVHVIGLERSDDEDDGDDGDEAEEQFLDHGARCFGLVHLVV